MISLQNMVLEYLSKLIVDGEHNQMLPSQAQLCKKFNVSVITVRSALEKLEKEGMIFRKQGKGCFIHKVRSKKCDTIRLFLFLPLRADINNEFVATLATTARDEKCHVMFYNYHENDIDLIHEIRNFRADAIIWIAPNVSNSYKLIEELSRLNCHLLLFNRECDLPNVNYITGDHLKDGHDVAGVLLKHDPEKILYVGFDQLTDHSRLRYEGFCDALLDSNYDFKKFHTISVDCEKYNTGDLIEPVSTSISGSLPDKIVCSQGAFLDDIYNALSNSGVDYSKIEMASFNTVPQNHPLKAVTHELIQPIDEMGVKTIQQLKRLINQEEKSVKLKVASKIIVKK